MGNDRAGEGVVEEPCEEPAAKRQCREQESSTTEQSTSEPAAASDRTEAEPKVKQDPGSS